MNKKGFTLVELMAAIVVSSIIVVTVGALFLYSMENWNDNSRSVNLQRDATIAMENFYRQIRPASSVAVTGSTLNFTRDNIIFSSFSLSGGDLVYDPDTSSAGDESIIVANIMTNLNFINNGARRSVAVSMALSDGGQVINLNSEIMRRN